MYSSSKYLMSTIIVPDAMLGAKHSVENKTLTVQVLVECSI